MHNIVFMCTLRVPLKVLLQGFILQGYVKLDIANNYIRPMSKIRCVKSNQENIAEWH